MAKQTKNFKREMTEAELCGLIQQAPPDVAAFSSLSLETGTIQILDKNARWATSYTMNPVLLCCAVFSSNRASADRNYVETTYNASNGASIEFRGKELCQDDLTVLLALIHDHAGKCTTEKVVFAPYSFCKKIWGSAAPSNVMRLHASILRMKGAFLIVRAAPLEGRKQSKLAAAIGSGWTMGFIENFQFKDLPRWEVTIDPRIGQLFQTQPTYLIIERRQQLTEGIQTWLYGFIEANTCHYALDLTVLHTHSGSTAPLKEFARQVRDAIPKLIAAGVLKAPSTVKNGKVSFFKVHGSAPRLVTEAA
jgi:hypothetical protein